MGILNKLLFWRHDDEMDFDKIADEQLKTGIKDDPLLEPDTDFEEKSSFSRQQQDLRSSSMKGSPYKQTNFQQQPTLQQPSENIEKDLELISSKLDTIKAMLGSLDQRTANLEKAAGVQQQRRERLW
ncbi:MAG TPA: hypothetical protein VJB13_00395 [Candidatus Nanoarchaeia archaeon]|nr:hypothetical protein [Candidatus Nanoarchaeia archaeon]